jgi:hypothetical protein
VIVVWEMVFNIIESVIIFAFFASFIIVPICIGIYNFKVNKPSPEKTSSKIVIQYYKGKIIGVIYCPSVYAPGGSINLSRVDYNLLLEYKDNKGYTRTVTTLEVFSCKEIAEYRTHDYVEFVIFGNTCAPIYRPYEEIDGGGEGGDSSALKGLEIIEVERDWSPSQYFTGEIENEEYTTTSIVDDSKPGEKDEAYGFTISQKNEKTYVVNFFYRIKGEGIKEGKEKVSLVEYEKIIKLNKLPIIIFKKKACIDKSRLS